MQPLSIPSHKKIILVGGCFDIMHFGHIKFLEKAHQAGDYLIVALESDECIIENKKRTPTHTQMERAYNLLALRYVDNVILLPFLNNFQDYLNFVKTVNPHIIAITNNDPQINNKQKQAIEVNAQLVIVTNIIGSFSSSSIYHNNTY